MPGIRAMIVVPGSKPSFMLYGLTSMRPLVPIGIAPWGKCRRRPVSVFLSALVKRLLGNGIRQGVGPNGVQSMPGGASPLAVAEPANARAAVAAAIAPTLTRRARTPNLETCPATSASLPFLNNLSREG